MKITLLLTLFANLFVAANSQSVNCALANEKVYSYSTIQACVQLFPYNSTVAKHTAIQLQRAMELYAFEDIAQNPPDAAHFFPPVDLRGLFAKLQNTTFPSDFAFQEQIRGTFLQLHDAHTNYYGPDPQRFFWMQPFNLVAIGNNASDASPLSIFITELFVPPVTAYWQAKGVDLSQFGHAQVLQIDNVDAFPFLQQFATKNVGSAKDPQTRFNILFAVLSPNPAFAQAPYVPWLGMWGFRSHHFMLAPSQPSHIYKLKLVNGSVVDVTFDWVGAPFKSYNSTAEYVNAYWNSASSSSGQQKAEMDAQMQVWLQKVEVPMPQKRTEDPRASQIVPVSNSTVSGVAFYQLGDDTLVWYQNNFEPADYDGYFRAVSAALIYADLAGLNKIIFDMTMNGGGDICLGRAMLQLLFPNQEFPKSFNFGPTDLPVSPLAINLTLSAKELGVTQTPWSGAFYQYQNGTQNSNQDISWLLPGIKRTRGGLTRPYSQLVHISAEIPDGSFPEGCGIPPFKIVHKFKPENAVILTRGFCGSTCALFTDSLADYLNIKTVVYGGYDVSQGQSWRSFPGLQVLETPGFYSILDALGQETADQSCTKCTAPRRLLTSSGYRLCIREIYKNDQMLDAPLEYLWQPADLRYQFTRNTVAASFEVWDEIYQNVFSAKK